MKQKINLRLTLLIIFFIFLFIIYVIKSNLSSSSTQNTMADPLKTYKPPSCTKLPSTLANTIIHYATLNITPQQTMKEISITAQILHNKSPCNFLVFGLGHDSLMWSSLNHGGHTVFLEEDKSWIDSMTQKFPSLKSYHVTYDTKVSQADELLKLRNSSECTLVGDHKKFSKCPLASNSMPSVVYDVEWDLIMVDAPTGYFDGAPGRMGAIYITGMLARWRREGETNVFVHDVDRGVEDKFSKAFLCEKFLKDEEGRLRHFIIPSYRYSKGMPFCP